MNLSKFSRPTLRRLTALALPIAIMAACSEGTAPHPSSQSDAGASSVQIHQSLDPGAVTTVQNPATPITKVAEVHTSDQNTAQFPAGAPPLYRLHFETDKAVVADADREELKRHAQYLLDHPEYVLHIEGHADVRGTKPHNADLSARRAQQVAQVLATYGVPQMQFTMSGFGAEIPLQDVAHWDENRRVELKYDANSLLGAR